MAKFQIGPRVDVQANITARLGTAADLAHRFVDNDMGKWVKLYADSAYALCDAGDPIEGRAAALEPATQDGFAIGTVNTGGTSRLSAICDGLQATPGTGTIAVGDYVVCGTVVALGTALTYNTPAKVCKATQQPGGTIDNSSAATVATGAAASVANGLFAWRVMALGVAGAVGDTCIIERVNNQ